MCDVVKIRRELHQIPEVGMNLSKTVEYIVNHLKEFKNIEINIIDGKGIIAKTKHHAGNRFIAFRSDMDALPIQELNNVRYKSTHHGVMHACGHDAHMAILLCFAEYINSMKAPPIGVMFIFQPGEEGNAGAKWMLEQGIFDYKTPEKIFALHMFPSLNTGSIATRSGPLFIGTEEFYLTLTGSGGHAGFPEKTTDLLEIFSNIYQHSRDNAKIIASGRKYIFFFGKTTTNGKNNVFPSLLKSEGTIRAYTPSLIKSLENILRETCNKYAKKSFQLSFSTTYPPLINDPESVSIIFKAAEQNKIDLAKIDSLKIGEDFSFFLKNIPGAMFLLGCSGKEIKARELHSQTFDIDESSLSIGVKLYITIYDLCIKYTI